MSDRDYEVGYGKPPKHSRFKKGQSGNPRGRPKKSKNFSTLLEEELSAEVVVTENGRKRRLTKGGALAKRIVNDGLSGKVPSQKLLLGLLQYGMADSPESLPDFDDLDQADRQALEAFKRQLLDGEQADAGPQDIREGDPDAEPRD